LTLHIQVKICGLKTQGALAAAVKAGAAFVGLVFHPASARAISLEAAASLRREIPESVKCVALVVDPNDRLIAEISAAVRPDVFQLHGNESVKRAAEIRSRTMRPIIKALPIARAEDFAAVAAYEEIADWLMFDAKLAAGAASPGGGGQSFDWKLLSGRTFRRPWFLAGGLNSANLKEAVEVSGARLVDVSSGVERARGEKDEGLIRTFLDTAKTL
jgi:phosphoribosylanthranilate isomerase